MGICSRLERLERTRTRDDDRGKLWVVWMSFFFVCSFSVFFVCRCATQSEALSSSRMGGNFTRKVESDETLREIHPSLYSTLIIADYKFFCLLTFSLRLLIVVIYPSNCVSDQLSCTLIFFLSPSLSLFPRNEQFR